VDQAQLNALLDEGFKIWEQVVDFDPERRSFSLGSWSIKKQAKEVQEARRLDTTGLTAFMFLKAITHRYIEEETVSSMDIIRGFSEEQQARIDLLQRMYQFLERPEVDEIIDGFTDSIRLATAHYGIDHKDLDSWLESYYWLAILRRGAMRAFDKLETHQFLHGDPGSSERFVYSTKVWEFWNVPSLIRAMQAQGRRGFRGINLCLIRDPVEALFSFFVIAIVNGESLTILTDRDKHAHPHYKQMARRPDREFESRAHRNWFPYELVSVSVSEDQKRLWANARTGIVPINAQAVELADFSSLHPADAIWLTLLFELIREKYLQENKQLPELSYTTEMIRSPHLLAGAHSEIVERGKYKPLIIEPYQHSDITAETTKDNWKREAVGHNEWMIERYGSQVPIEALNVIGQDELMALPLPEHLQKGGDHDRYIERRELETLDALGFGTKEMVERDRQWTARYNQCVLIQRLAMREFKETEEELRKWVNERLIARREWFIEHAVRLDLSVIAPEQRNGFSRSVKLGDRPIAVATTKKEFRPRGRRHTHWINKPGLTQRDEECPITGGATISYWATFTPPSAEAIAILLGCPLDELPWQLQVWLPGTEPVYIGNSILERLDPSDWVLKNPWVQFSNSVRGFPIRVIVALSKRGVNRMRKELGLERFDWENHESHDYRY
jgi:hypothetical protein